MKHLIVLIACIGLVMGCTRPTDKLSEGRELKTLEIVWQRLVDEQGQTCDRCGTTEAAVNEASRKLNRSLRVLGIHVVLTKKVLSPAEFKKDPLESNRMWISGEPIERWLAATTGESQCSTACGTSECRTVTIDGETYEAISADLNIKAGLLAGAQLLQGEPSGSSCAPPDSIEEGAVCCPAS